MSFVTSYFRPKPPPPPQQQPPTPPKPQIQKAAVKAAPKGPTSLEIAAQNKRKGRRATRLTSATGATEEYKLSKKSLLG